MEINKKSTLVCIAFALTAIGAFFYMNHIVNCLFQNNLPYESLQEQILTQYKYFIKGVVVHFFCFLFIAFLGWYYFKRKQHLYAISRGFLYSIYIMSVLGILYLIVFF